MISGMPGCSRCGLSGGCWPTFYVIGAPKSGSSTMNALLNTVGVCNAGLPAHNSTRFRSTLFKFAGEGVDFKEPCFFSMSVGHWESMEHKDYMAFFRHCKSTLYADSSSTYLAHPLSPVRIRAFVAPCLLPAVKIVAILREPISRDLSRFNHQASNLIRGKFRNLGGCFLELAKRFSPFLPTYEEVAACETGKWDECIDSSSSTDRNALFEAASTCVSRLVTGMYAPQIQRWLAVWPGNQVLVLDFHKIVQSSAMIPGMLKWLGLPPSHSEPHWPHANEESYPDKVTTIDCTTRRSLDKVFSPFNEMLYSLLATHNLTTEFGKVHFHVSTPCTNTSQWGNGQRPRVAVPRSLTMVKASKDDNLRS